MELNEFKGRFEGDDSPSWITEEELMEWKKRMEVEFEGLPSHFQTPETCRKYFDNGYCPKNIFVSLASHQSTIYNPHRPFGLWNSAINNECYEINFEPAKKSREWSENEAQLLNIIFFVKWENGVYKINETQAKNKVEEEFNKDGCSSFRAKLERFSKAETSSVRNEIYNQRGTEENYKFPRSIKLDYKQIVDRFLEIVKEKAGETSSILADNSHDPLKEKKEETCERIKNFLAEEGIKASDLRLTNQNWEKNVMKADFEWQIDNITRKVIVNTNFVKERIKTKSDQKVVGTTSNSKLGSSPTDSLGKKLEESIQDNDFSTQRNESNQETKETQPSNVTNPEVFPWKLVVPVFLLLAGSLVLGFLITKKEKPSQNQPRSRDTIKPTRN